jgi:hypothetical protein
LKLVGLEVVAAAEEAAVVAVEIELDLVVINAVKKAI